MVICIFIGSAAARAVHYYFYQYIGGASVGVFSPCVCHVHQFFIFSSLPLVSTALFALALLVKLRRRFVCTHSYMGSDTAMYKVPGIVFVVVPCI